MSQAPNILSSLQQLAALSSSDANAFTQDSNQIRRSLELGLSKLCSETTAVVWLPLFIGSRDDASVDGLLSLEHSPLGPSVQSFVAASFLSDHLARVGKSVQANNKGSSFGNFVVTQMCSLIFEIATVSASSGATAFSKSLLNWSRKLASIFSFAIQNNTQDLTLAIRALTEFANFAFEIGDGLDLSALTNLFPFRFTQRTVASLQGLSATGLIGNLKASLITLTLTFLHVMTKTITEKILSRKALKSIQLAFVGPALINGEWIQELFFRISGESGTFFANTLSLARVIVAKLTATVLKVVLATSAFPAATGSTVFFHSVRGSAVGASILSKEVLSNFIVGGLGSMLTQFSSTYLPEVINLVTTGANDKISQIMDPLRFRANYFLLKAFSRVLTDSFDGAVGVWTEIISPDICASCVVSPIFGILMVLPSVQTCESTGRSFTFNPSSSDAEFDIVAQFDKLFLLCSSSIQHICSMDESVPYYAQVLQSVFPTQSNAQQSMQLAASVIRRILVEYLRDDNSTRGSGRADFKQHLLSQWQSDPEKHFEELLLLNDGDTAEGAAEQLFTALTGAHSCQINRDSVEKQLFPEAAWHVVNEMLQFNVSGTQASEEERELAKLMAYRAIGLGHYSLCEGQDENYRSFFYSSLLPEMQDVSNTSPLVQRRAIWCIGMWCESATIQMSKDFYQALATLLSTNGGALNPVILLTALKALEHFVNDNAFDATHLPEGFVQMLFRGLHGLFPLLKSPVVIQSICGLVYVMVSKCGAFEGVGDLMLEMFTPAISRFSEEVAKGNSTSTGDDWGEGDDGDDDDGDIVAVISSVFESLSTAMYSPASDCVKWESPMTSPLLALLRLLSDPPSEEEGRSGHYQALLEEDAWELLGAMVRTTRAEFLLSSSSAVETLVQIGTYAFSPRMMERDFESKPIYLRFLIALWLLLENYAAQGGQHSILGVLDGARDALQSFSETELTAAMESSNVEMTYAAVEAACLLTVLPSTSAVSAPKFMKIVSDFFFNNSSADLESCSGSPSILTLLTYTIPRCIPHGTPAPHGLSDIISAISDVTTSVWSTARLLLFSRFCVSGHLDFSGNPVDRATLVAVEESCTANLESIFASMGEEIVGDIASYTGQHIAESLSDDSRLSPHVTRLHQLLSVM